MTRYSVTLTLDVDREVLLRPDEWDWKAILAPLAGPLSVHVGQKVRYRQSHKPECELVQVACEKVSL